jgi:O-antigen/teichoic acid export membrane protein
MNMFSRKIKELKILRLSEFNRNSLIVGGGTLIGQLIPFLILPIITRLYSNKDFGIFTSFSTFLGLTAIFLNGRYDYAILLPKEHAVARRLFNLAITIAILAISVLGAIALLLYFGNNIRAFIPIDYNYLICFLPLAAVAVGLTAPANFMCIRHKYFTSLSLNKIIRAITISILSILLGFWGWSQSGLIVGDTIGQLLGSFYLLYYLYKEGKIDFPRFDALKRAELYQLAKAYIKFPKFNIPSAVCEHMAGVVTITLLSSGFGLALVGSFGFAQRVIISPSSIVARAIGDVFRQSASQTFAEQGACREVYWSTFKKLAVISVVPFLIFYPFAPFLFRVVFGPDWEEAGRFTQILAPMFVLQFIAQPLGNMFLIAEKQQWDFMIQITLLTALCIGLSGAIYLSQSAAVCLAIYASIYCIKYLSEIYLSYHLASNVKGDKA